MTKEKREYKLTSTKHLIVNRTSIGVEFLCIQLIKLDELSAVLNSGNNWKLIRLIKGKALIKSYHVIGFDSIRAINNFLK
jgi:hypothetical protein